MKKALVLVLVASSCFLFSGLSVGVAEAANHKKIEQPVKSKTKKAADTKSTSTSGKAKAAAKSSTVKPVSGAKGKSGTSVKSSKASKVSSKGAKTEERTSAREDVKTAFASCSPGKATKGRHGKGKTSRAAAKCAKPEPVLASPIDSNALSKSATDSKEPEIKARTVPERAYAVDGSTFFFRGRKFRIARLPGSDVGSEMATQRLQKALDSGTLMVDQVSVDETGVATAEVKISGRDIVDMLALP